MGPGQINPIIPPPGMHSVTPKMDLGGAMPSSAHTLRDTFAMHALSVMPRMKETVTPEELPAQAAGVAIMAYMIADAMVAERAKSMKYKPRKGQQHE